MISIAIPGRKTLLGPLVALTAGAILMSSGTADAFTPKPRHLGHPHVTRMAAKRHGEGGLGGGMAGLMGDMPGGMGGMMGGMGGMLSTMRKLSASVPGGQEMLTRGIGAALVMGGIVPSPIGGAMPADGPAEP